MTTLVAGLGTQELLLIFAVLVLLFGATKLPELARGSGRALRIFKAETKGLTDDDSDLMRDSEQLELERRWAELQRQQAELDVEAERLRRGDAAT